MNCPKCLTAVREGAMICDNCDHILDLSFLGDGITNDGEQAEDEPAEQEGAQVDDGETRIKPKAEVKARPKAKAEAKAPAAPAARVQKVPVPSLPEKEDTTESKLRKPKLDEVAAVPSSTGEALDELTAQFKALPFVERIAAGGGLTVLLSLVLPWSSNRNEDDVIGLVGGGLPIGLLAGLVIAIAWFRRHPKLVAYREYLFQASAGTSVLAVLWCLYFIRTARVEHRIKGFRAQILLDSWPSIGAYLGLLAAAVMTYGAVRAYLGRSKLE